MSFFIKVLKLVSLQLCDENRAKSGEKTLRLLILKTNCNQTLANCRTIIKLQLYYFNCLLLVIVINCEVTKKCVDPGFFVCATSMFWLQESHRFSPSSPDFRVGKERRDFRSSGFKVLKNHLFTEQKLVINHFIVQRKHQII